jgi:uncharacterized protein
VEKRRCIAAIEKTPAQAQAVRQELIHMLEESFRLLLPTAADFATAASFLETPQTGLRAGDALHLAIAANHSIRKIYTLDQGFIKAGKQLKLPVSAGIQLRHSRETGNP